MVLDIGRDSWIGDRAVVMADVGRHCVVAAGAVVTKPVPDFAVVVGVPARVVRSRKPAATASLQGLPHAHTPGPDGGRSVRSEPEA